MADPTGEVFHFPVLKLVNESRSTYGLRHQDFARYHAHCTAKVQYLRKSLKLTQVAGKSRKFAKKDISAQNATSAKHLQVILFEAERAWAHAQEVKLAAANPNKATGSQRHLVRRLAKAASHAEHLVNVVNELSGKLTGAQTGQATAYHLVMKGTYEFEKARYADGLNSLSVAHELLAKLATSADTAHNQALANEMIDEAEPMLRFCAYKTGLDTSEGVAKLAQATAAQRAETAVPGYLSLVRKLENEGQQAKKETVELSWRGKAIPVRSAELVDVVIKVKQSIDTLKADRSSSESTEARDKQRKGSRREVMGQRRMGTYDKALLVLSDAEAVASQLVDDNKIALSKSNSTRHEASSSSLQLAHAFIVYQLLSVRIKRDLLLVKDTSAKLEAREVKIRAKERDFVATTGVRNEDKADKKIRKQRARTYPSIVKLYDGIVQSLETMRDLESVEQDGDLASKVEARIAMARASRCTYLARTYALVDQHPSALALNSRGKLYARQARHAAASLDLDEDELEVDLTDDLLPLSPTAFDSLDRELDDDHTRISKGWFAVTGGRVGDDVEPEDLAVDSLTLEGAQGPKPKKKPAFYDIAFNYVAAFDMDAIARKAGLKEGVVEEEETVPATLSGRMDVDAEEAPASGPESEDEEEVEPEPQPAKRGWGFGLFGRR